MPDGYGADAFDHSAEQSPAVGMDSEPVADAAADEEGSHVEDAQPSAVALVEASDVGWDEALAYADYLHTDAVLLVLGVWICAGIMLARIMLDRVVP